MNLRRTLGGLVLAWILFARGDSELVGRSAQGLQAATPPITWSIPPASSGSVWVQTIAGGFSAAQCFTSLEGASFGL